jgi:hypothetical protein
MKYKSTEFFRKFFWIYLRKNILWNSLVGIKKGRFKVSFNIWKGFFSGISWGFKNKKLSWKHFF